ncbi:30S ribosomal protein S16 [Bradymonas sediminis]|uniref:Small ribosomal subunit protein bS16 n=1 Tax=Bradymonas sediminis TaxID=1548548 RepID=A0A2Z4FNP9_9DELT|nr:30S ribosomal protein S16 [Bradymonas sediminis]AWV90356.1 30S ribosomal protein S16 [Bradymonas sediminis]TDP75667.1 SSU ribosomal protein S16P [Bradymonas sediminis]
MSVRLRLQRHGAKKRPHYRVVATDQRNSRDGRFIELLGTYDPLQDPPVVRMNSERVEYWIGVGAQPSETVGSLVRRMRRGDVVDLSVEGADKAARKAKAASKLEAQKEMRAKAAEAAKAAKAAKEAEAKAAEEAKKAEAAAAAKAAEEAKKAEAAEAAKEEAAPAEAEAPAAEAAAEEPAADDAKE